MTTEEYDLMGSLRAFPAVLAVAAGLLLAGCSGGPETPRTSGRAPGDPILGVTSASDPPECVEPVVRRTAGVGVLELTISGQPGDVVDYEVVRHDGSAVTGTTGMFGPGQRQAVLTTGVPNADVAQVTLSATGWVGMPGSCVITTIR